MAGLLGEYAKGLLGFVSDPQSWKDMGRNAVGLLGAPLPTQQEAQANLQRLRMRGSVMRDYPGAETDAANAYHEKMTNLALGMNPIMAISKVKAGYVPANVQSQIDRSIKPTMLTPDLSMKIRTTADGQKLLEFDPLWGSSQKPFWMMGDNADELAAAGAARVKNSDKAIEAATKAKQEKSLLGQLTAEFGDTFKVAKSERSKSEYLTHVPSGQKIRISDHDLPLGYVQADLDLPMGMPISAQLAAIKKLISGE